MDEAQTNEDPMLAAALSALPDHEAALLVVLDAWRTWRPFSSRVGAPDQSCDREAELLREHASAWSGPLDLCSREVRFERGFPSIVVLRRPRWHTRRAIPAPEWATIEELDVGDLSEDASCIHELLWKAPLPQLRRVRGISQALAEELLLLRPTVEMMTTD